MRDTPRPLPPQPRILHGDEILAVVCDENPLRLCRNEEMMPIRGAMHAEHRRCHGAIGIRVVCIEEPLERGGDILIDVEARSHAENC